VLLRKRDRTSWDHILDIVTEKLGYMRLPTAAKKLIDLETKEHVTSTEQLQNGHIYVAIDRPDHVVMPPFKVGAARVAKRVVVLCTACGASMANLICSLLHRTHHDVHTALTCTQTRIHAYTHTYICARA
jgi:hypothetical protein